MMTMSNEFCLICNINLDISACINIFCTSFPRNGELFVNFISKILKTPISELQSSYICTQCYNLFQMLEQAQKTVLNIRREILKIYHTTERRKSIKQTNEIKLNANTNVLEENKADIDKSNGRLKEESNLQSVQFKKKIKQQVQDKIVNQNVTVPNIDYSINIKAATDLKRNIKQKANDCNKTDSTKLYNYNDSNNKDEILKNEVFCNAMTLSSDNNAYKIATSQANIHALSSINSEKNESKGFIKVNSIFSDDKLQVQHIDFEWKETDENVTEIKENTESATAANVDQIKVPLKSGKISKGNRKSLKYCCPTCGKIWKSSTDLNAHIKTHSKLRPYMCEKCGQAYKHKHALEIHVGMHNGINPFQCNFCNKSFTQKGALMRHLPMHTGEMPYQCELCGKRFVHHTSYNMHKLSHSGKKSYKCHLCDLSLLSTSHLKRHMRVHTGEKPYSCTLCGKRFAERYNLFAHQKIHDPLETKTKKTIKEIQFRCNYCDLTFENEQNLNDHEKQHVSTNEPDLKESCSVLRVEPENDELAKKLNSEPNLLQETWLQVNRSKLNTVGDQTRFVLFQNPLIAIDENSLDDQKISLESTNYNTNLQVIIEPSNTSTLNANLPSIDKF